VSYIAIDGETILDELGVLIRQARELMDSSAEPYFEGRRRTLSAAFGIDDPNEFTFGLEEGKPLRTRVSREHKGIQDSQASAGAVRAELTFKWVLIRRVEAPKRFNVKKGGVNVSFFSETGTPLRKFHYDACRGGPDENGGLAQHPFSHFQYSDGLFSDLPRLPSLLFTPSDIMEQVLLDLWPMKWPSISNQVQSRTAMAGNHFRQKARLEVSANRFVEMAKAHLVPLRGLQSRLAADLYL
jgi:hypothetical protein